MTIKEIKVADWTDVQVGDFWTGGLEYRGVPQFPNYKVTVVRVGEVKPSEAFPGEQYIEIEVEVEDFARRWVRRPYLGNGPLTITRPN